MSDHERRVGSHELLSAIKSVDGKVEALDAKVAQNTVEIAGLKGRFQGYANSRSGRRNSESYPSSRGLIPEADGRYIRITAKQLGVFIAVLVITLASLFGISNRLNGKGAIVRAIMAAEAGDNVPVPSGNEVMK